MKRILVLLLTGLFFTSITVNAQGGATGGAVSPSAGISEGATVKSTININGSQPITDVNVSVNISHSHGGDLRIRLTHENTGRSIILLRWLNGPGYAFGCGADAIDASFDDSAIAPMDAFDCSSNFELPVYGAWQPTEPLAIFNGEAVGGAWTLEVNDVVRSDNGVLNSWSITFNDLNAPPPPAPPAGVNPLALAPPPDPECADFDGSISGVVRIDLPLDYGVYCRIIAQNRGFRRNPAYIGIESVMQQGVIHAIDIYSPAGYNAVGAVVCVKGQGRVIFLNAADAPRVPRGLGSVYIDDFTCATIPGLGTFILVELREGEEVNVVSSSSAPPRAGNTFVSSSEGTTLTNCTVTTTNVLNMRAAPGRAGEVLTELQPGLTLTATELKDGWYRVVYLGGQGWVSGQFLEVNGSCS